MSEKLNNQESQLSEFPELFSLTSEQAKSIKEAIRQSDGFARVLVHPSFHQDFPGDESYYKTLKKVVKQSKEVGSPIILFESDEKLERTKEMLSDDLSANVLLIRTHLNRSSPKFEDEGSDENRERDDILGVCQILRDEFGLRRVIVGGQLVDFYKSSPYSRNESGYSSQKHIRNKHRKTDSVGACVGTVAEAMAREGIKTDVSLITNKIDLNEGLE